MLNSVTGIQSQMSFRSFFSILLLFSITTVSYVIPAFAQFSSGGIGGGGDNNNTATDGTTHKAFASKTFVALDQQNSSPSLEHAQESYSSLPFSESLAEEAIYRDLKNEISIDAEGGLSLREFAVYFQDASAIPARLDERVLAGELGLDINEPGAIYGSCSGVSAQAALSILLSNVFETPLTYVIKDEVLLITDKQYAADNYRVLRFYPLPFTKDTSYTSKLIQATIQPTAWENVGGSSSIVPYHNNLLIGAPLQIHEDIEEALINIERMEGIRHGNPCCRVHHIADEKLRQYLADSLIETCNTTLGDRSDKDVKVSINGEFVTVRSASRPFLVYSEELINAFQTHGSPNGLRTWTDITGKFSRKARFVSLSEGVVEIQLATGEQKSIPLEKLSTEDQEYASEKQKLLDKDAEPAEEDPF